MRILVYGAGNLLLSDEGFGVHFVRYLAEHYIFPEHVDLLDAGTLGLMVSHRLEEAERVYIIDAIAVSGLPGTLRRYGKTEFMAQRLPLKLSPHQAGVQEMLLVSELRGRCPQDIFLLGVIPASMAPGIELTPCVHDSLALLASELVSEFRTLGISVTEVAPETISQMEAFSSNRDC